MALWDSADLLARCQLHARRPATDASMPAASWYSLLTEAQAEAFPDLFTRYPDLQYAAPVLLTTSDSGKTYKFGTDAASDLVRPMGHAEIYADLASIPDSPLVLGSDFMFEGTVIRMLANSARTFSAGPYARFVLRPDTAIDATHQPILQPKNARMLLVWKALEYWAARPGSGVSPLYFLTKYQATLTSVWTELATAYNGQGGSGSHGNQRWWTLGDLGRSGLNT